MTPSSYPEEGERTEDQRILDATVEVAKAWHSEDASAPVADEHTHATSHVRGVVWVDEPRLAALFHIAHCALSGLEGSEATEQAVDQNLDTADALRADLIKWIATAQTPLVSGLEVGSGEGDWRESDAVKAARKTLTDYEGPPDYVPLPESQWAALLEGVLAERDFIGEWLQRMLDDAAGAESVHDAYDKGWSEAEAHFATTTAGAEWERAELWRSKANDMDSRLKLATAFVENAGPVVGNRAELLLILSDASTTSGSAATEKTNV